MSRVQLTEAEAIFAIDEILDKQLNGCVAATYNELIAILNENAAAGRKTIKGSLTLGFHPTNSNCEDICFYLAQQEILALYTSTLSGGKAKLSQIGKFSYRFNLFGWDSNPYPVFAFQFFGGLFNSINKTGKLFLDRLNGLLLDTGIKLSAKKGQLVTSLILSYSCDIPSWYMQKESIEIEEGLFETTDKLVNLIKASASNNAYSSNNETPQSSLDMCDQCASEEALYSVVLKEIGPRKIEVIKVVKESTKLGLAEAKKLVEDKDVIKRNMTKEAAETLVSQLSKYGAIAEII